jgi:parallel beta-helix repeat protein
MKNIILVLTIYLGTIFYTNGQELKISKEEAINLILNEICVKDTGKVDIFISKSPIPKTDGLLIFEQKLECPYEFNWVFFIDDCVTADWMHPCRYIFVNTASKEFTIVNANCPPVHMKFFDSISRIKQNNKLSDQKIGKSCRPATVQTATPNPHLYAVLISGGVVDTLNHIRYWNNLSAVYCTLTQVYGYQAANIIVHSTDGTSAHNHGSLDLDNDGQNEINTAHVASLSSIQSTFSTLANTIGPDDQLFIYVTDHGNRDVNIDQSYVCLWDFDENGIYDKLYSSNLNTMLSGINASEIIIVMQQCNSGGFLTDAINCTGAHRSIYTSCESTGVSFADIYISTALAYDEFTLYWVAAARGYYPQLSGSPWNNSYSLGSFPFSNYFSSHPSDYSPDSNGDGIIQMYEAFSYANNFDTYSPSGYYNPEPPGYSESPQYYKNIGFQEDLLSLSGISGTLYTNQTISGNFLFSGNLTVPYSTYPMLTISASSKLHFNNGASLISNGNLQANGGSAAGAITFDFLSVNNSTYNGLKFNSGSSGNINYCKVLNGYYGINENSASVNISNSNISNCKYGIYLYGSNAAVNNNYIHDNTEAGVYLTSSTSPTFLQNNIQNNQTYGVFCTTNSSPKFGNSTNGNGNKISGNVTGVFCYNNGIPYLGDASYRYNQIYNTTNNVYNMCSGVVSAMYAWWGAYPPTYKLAGSGNVNVSYPCTTAAQANVPDPTLPKSSSSDEKVIEIPLFSELEKANELITEKNLEQAREVCLNLINNYPDYSVSYNALNMLKETYAADDISGKKNIYKSLFNSKEKKDIYAMAGLILSDIDKENRLKHIEDVISKYEGESIIELALFDKFVYYNFELSDIENSMTVSNELDKLFPLSIGAIEAHRILGDEEYFKIDITPGQDLHKTASKTPIEYALSDNYPNPFNPTTTINYQIPEDGFVTLKVYDILGREVASLVNENKKAGYYSRDFDASKLSSGVYIYKVTANNFVQSKKMLMIK